MTLDEVISSFEKAADYDCYNDEQRALAAEYAQIAEWLRELKELRHDKGAGDYLLKKHSEKVMAEVEASRRLFEVANKHKKEEANA